MAAPRSSAPTNNLRPIKRALISVSDKTDIADFAKQLHSMNIEIISTGGTAKILQQQHIPVTEISTFTGFPEIMDGRVKTLHPKVHAAILARRGIDDQTLVQHQIDVIDLVVVNLYPFEKTILKRGSTFDDAIENIDIGGPTLLRAAAKNHRFITVISEPSDYQKVIDELTENNQQTTLETRVNLAQKAFAHCAYYDANIANYLSTKSKQNDDPFPDLFTVNYRKKQTLRYGENPHQHAAFYVQPNQPEASISSVEQIQGKALSFNNIADSDAALECVKAFNDQAACVIVKHANPCGVAYAENQIHAYQKAFSTDPTSAFGGIIAFNQKLIVDTVEAIIDQQFVEVIIAPDIEEDAKQLLTKKPNIRVLIYGHQNQSDDKFVLPNYDYKRVNGGMLIQQFDHQTTNVNDLKLASQRSPTSQEIDDLLFAWKVVKFVKSNAIVFAKNSMTIGIGAGQMSRIDSTSIALTKARNAGLDTHLCVLASDAFFPFRDNIDEAAKAGVQAIIQPGGSIRDDEIIAAANEHGMVMIFTAIRHFRH